MKGWYVVYLLVCFINGATLSMMGYNWRTPQFWIIAVCIMLSHISGRELKTINSYKTCENAIFDPLLGEYKCQARNVYIYDTDKCADCPHYKKGEPKETKEPYYGREGTRGG